MASKQRQLERWKNLQTQPIVTELKCSICDYSDSINKFKIYRAKDIFNAGELIRYQCPNCETIFGDLRFLGLPLAEIQQDYEDLYSYYKEGDTTNYILFVLQNIKFLNKNGKHLDFACGKWNKLIPTLRAKGYNIIGYDKYVTGEKYILNKLDPSAKFDVIYNNNYIEHLINPIDDIREMVDLLNIGGHIVFITQCFEYCIEFSHYHTFFFNDKSLKIIADKLGLTPVYSNKFKFPDGQWTIAKVFRKN